MRAVIESRHLVILHNFAEEPGTAGAQDASFGVEDDIGAQIDDFMLVHLGFAHAAGHPVVHHVIILKLAFAGVVANRAIEGMAEEQEFEDSLIDLFDGFGIGIDGHSIGNGGITGDGQHFPAVHFHFDLAHPATAGDGQSRMITEMGDFDTNLAAGFDQVDSRFKFVFLTVYGNFGHKVNSKCLNNVDLKIFVKVLIQ